MVQKSIISIMKCHRKAIFLVFFSIHFLFLNSTYSEILPLPGGRVSDIIYHQGVLYASFYGGGVWKSSDGGLNWQEMNTGLTNFYVEDLEISYDGTLYAATQGGVFYYSGNTWIQILSQPAKSIAINPFNSNNILIGTGGGGVLRSDDGGSTFYFSSYGLLDTYITVVRFHPNIPNMVYLGTWRYGVYYSQDGGTHWNPVSGIDVGRISDILITTNGTIYAAARQGSGGLHNLVDPNLGPLYKSVDGINFQKVQEFWGVNCLSQDKTGTIYFGTESGGPFASYGPDSDYFYNLVGDSSPLYSKVNAISADGDTLVVGIAGKGIFISKDNGLTWQRANLYIPAVETLRANPNGGFWAGTWKGGLIQYNPDNSVFENFSGLSLSSPPDKYPTVLAVEPISGWNNRIIVGTKGRGLFMTDDGLNFHRILESLEKSGWYTFNALSSDNSYVCAACYEKGLYQSVDGGNNFTLLSSVDSQGISLFIKTIASVGNGKFFAGRYDFGLLKIENGKIKEIDLPHPPGTEADWDVVPRHEFMRITVKDILYDNGIVYLATNKGLYISYDGGASFDASGFKKYPFGRAPICCLSSSNGGAIYLATEDGKVYKSIDKANSFYEIDTGLPDGAKIKDIIVNSKGELLLGTDGYGVWKSKRYSLSITKTGAGNGLITSQPSGISCGNTCTSNFDLNDSIQLNITLDNDSIFGGWGGDCEKCGTSIPCSISIDANKTCTATFKNIFYEIQKLYIAYYQRPADPAGLKFWAERLKEQGGSLEGIIDAFATSEEAIRLYDSNNDGVLDINDSEQMIESIYQALFNRPPDEGGKQYYLNALKNGHFPDGRPATAGRVALDILNGAINQDAIAIENKLKMSVKFTYLLDPDGDGTSEYKYDKNDELTARQWLRQFTSDSNSLISENEVLEFIQNNI